MWIIYSVLLAYTFFSTSRVLTLFIYFFFTTSRVLWAALEERSCVEFRKLFIPPRKSFNGGAPRRAVFASLPGALTCIMRVYYVRPRNVFYLAVDGSRRCYASVVRSGGGLAEFQGSEFCGKRARRGSRRRFVLWLVRRRASRTPLMPRWPLYTCIIQ